MEPGLEKGKGMIANAERILVFTGAGLSTESGVPDFRSPGGIWEKYDPSDFYYQRFLSDEPAREKYWQMSTELYETLKDAAPNAAHLAIKRLEDMGKLWGIVTQNIDDLHRKAGNSPEKIIEIHGTAVTVSCLHCGKEFDRTEIQARLQSGIRVPYCDSCNGPLKPDTLSFGQAMPQEKMFRANTLAEECDLCIALGSSLVVYPAASIPIHASRSGAKLMIVNRDPTPHDADADLVIHDSVTLALGAMV